MIDTQRTVLEGIRQKVFLDRYALKDQDGNPLEDCPEQMWHRVSKGIATVEQTTEKQIEWANKFYDILKDFQFVPGGRILTGAGTSHKVTYYNCFCIPSPEDSREGILDTLKTMTEIMARGGGVGINFSSLRPRGSYIKTVNGTASGPCPWIQLFSVATGEVIQQGGCFGPYVKIETDQGKMTASDLADALDSGEQIQALTHKGYRPIIAVFRNGIKNLFQVKTYSGFEIEVTKDHKMGVLHNDEITTVALEHLRVGSAILRFREESNTCHPTSICSITPIGEHETFDFEVEDVHMLVANGLYTSNSRRGALMAMLDDNHPDIEEFITCKKTPGWITHANLSICISDRFMHAVSRDSNWELTWNSQVQKVIRARYLWDLICQSAWESAEPGLMFIERVNKESNTWYYEKIRTCNPCGEQPLGDWGVCNLGALNLAAFVEDRKMNYDRLAEATKIAMRFLDNVIDATDYFIPENKEAQLGTRRTGLGTMGLADALIKIGVVYGSDTSLEIIDTIYGTIMSHAYIASIELAAEKGAFPKFDQEKYLQGKFIQKQSPWIREGIALNGIRNAVLLTQAPTGTTSLLAGVSSGIEPVYDFAMIRRDRTGEHVMYHPAVQEWYDRTGGSEKMPEYFVSSKDLTPEEHVRVQAKIQEYTDASISKTCNAPNEHTVEQVKNLYMLAYDSGCKGVTYYRDGSRDAVLTRVADEEKKESPVAEASMKHRPEIMAGYTIQVKAPEGKVNVTINSDEQGPLEVFVNVGKAGSDIAALSEALGRLISLTLQLPSAYGQDKIVEEICKQLRGIGGSRSVGFGENQVKSLPDAVARTLESYRIFSKETTEGVLKKKGDFSFFNGDQGRTRVTQEVAQKILGALEPSPTFTHLLQTTDNVCPLCGSFSMVHEEGCKKCHGCGYSEC
jgi:ribonucleotide reductase alpha subunit